MNFWKWFIQSLYNKKTIAQSRFRPITTTIGFVLFIVFVASIPYFLTFTSTTWTGVERLNNLLTEDLPFFEFVNGELKLDGSAEVYKTEFNDGFMLIDPDNRYTEQELVLLKDATAFQQQNILFISNGHVHSISYTLMGLHEFTKDDLSKRISDLQSFLPFLLLIISALIYVGLAGLVYLGISILALFGFLIKGERRSLQYRHFWSITAHALTLPLISLYWIDTLILSVPFSLFVLSTLVLVFLAIKSIPIPKKRAS
ncbi:DUF1189 domain-containing protein [Halalkalibacter akibai]|uniref:DUF1189 domain-containing protein n=1 Tax=Halalkalibacter akibai (strain ATCC 43226 / DSM 21942 / CIP 109018 / JCM 9157 / 1139) TaxID=1236973 RepID=W4QMW7_HALA3|nr:DUF1189 domain-containing protein [Halalkalibacter akibai]GAE33440.1 hypothetical protein JCM9157_442 [Halalkalibacter akibai JCM 9157]